MMTVKYINTISLYNNQLVSILIFHTSLVTHVICISLRGSTPNIHLAILIFCLVLFMYFLSHVCSTILLGMVCYY